MKQDRAMWSGGGAGAALNGGASLGAPSTTVPRARLLVPTSSLPANAQTIRLTTIACSPRPRHTFVLQKRPATKHQIYCILQSFYRTADALLAASDYLLLLIGSSPCSRFSLQHKRYTHQIWIERWHCRTMPKVPPATARLQASTEHHLRI
jgi:hypothetical protein